MDEDNEIPMTAQELRLRVEDLFLRVCANPDDAETAAAADRALLRLDQRTSP
jgi:hypothetical protein